MKRNNRKKQKNDFSGMRCPYCGSKVIYRSADGIYYDNSRNTMLYVCSKYPACDAYVRAQQGTRIPLGTMADSKLRALRKDAHHYFDLLYKRGIMTKQDAYQWLAALFAAPLSEAHIGHLGEYYCQQVIEKSRELLDCKNSHKPERAYADSGEATG